MNITTIISIGGIAICLWETLKARISQNPKFWSTFEFMLYLREHYKDQPFYVEDVKPSNWTLQRTQAVLTEMCFLQDLEKREIKKTYYVFRNRN